MHLQISDLCILLTPYTMCTLMQMSPSAFASMTYSCPTNTNFHTHELSYFPTGA